MASLLGKSFKIQSTASDTSGVQFRVGYDGSNKADFSVSSGGDLTIAPSGSDTNVTGRLAISDDLNVDSGVLFVDASTNRVGVNDTTPSYSLDVNGTARVTGATTLDSTLTVTGDANFDSGTLFVDESQSNVGIKRTSTNSNFALDINGRVLVKDDASSGSVVAIDSTSGRGGAVGFYNTWPTLLNMFGNSGAILADASTDATVYATSGNNVRLYAGGSERMRIDSSGRVGIGVSSPTTALHVRRTSGASIVKSNSTDTASYASLDAEGNDGSGTLYRFGSTYSTSAQYIASSTLLESSTGPLLLSAAAAETVRVYTNASERMRIDSSGRVLVGTTSARNNFFNTNTSALLQIEGVTGSNRRLSVISSESGSNAPSVLILAHQGSGTIGGNTLSSSGDWLGAVSFNGNDGSEFCEAANIGSFVDGTAASDSMPGRLVFSTTPSGSAFATERMRIDSSGNVLVGTTTTTKNLRLNQKLAVVGAGSNIYPGASFTGYAGTGSYYPLIDIQKSAGTTDGSMTAVSSGDGLGAIAFRGSDGTNFTNSVVLTAYADGTVASNQVPGALTIATANSSGTLSERMRINSSGNVLIGTTTAPTVSGGRLFVLGQSLFFEGSFSVGSPYTQNLQIDIVWSNWGGNSVVGLADIDVTLREWGHTAGVAFGRVFANSAGTATFSSFNTTNVTASQCTVTAASGGNYTLRITVNPSNLTDRMGVLVKIPASFGGTGTDVTSITASLV